MTITEIITRLEAATGPDRDLDAEIWLRFELGATRKATVIKPGPNVTWTAYTMDETRDGNGLLVTVPAFTDSMDAAIALLRKVLPNWFWRCGQTSLFPNGWAYISRLDPSHCDRCDEAASSNGKAANAASALCIALLRAIEAKGETA